MAKAHTVWLTSIAFRIPQLFVSFAFEWISEWWNICAKKWSLFVLNCKLEKNWGGINISWVLHSLFQPPRCLHMSNASYSPQFIHIKFRHTRDIQPQHMKGRTTAVFQSSNIKIRCDDTSQKSSIFKKDYLLVMEHTQLIMSGLHRPKSSLKFVNISR